MRRKLTTCLAGLALTAFVGAGIAQAEFEQEGNLIVSLQGRITPYALPRDDLAPVAVHVKGSIKTVNDATPQPLRKVVISLNRHGKLFTRGLPICESGLLEATTTEKARENCGPALVGRGHFEADVALPTLSPFPAMGTLLAFNARVDGKPAILLHIYGSSPIPHTFVLPMTIRQRPEGTYGTQLSLTIPKIAANVGYVTGVEMKIGREFQYKGRKRSLLSASCAAPPGFPGALFTFARGSFTFANGQTISTRLVRDCKVKQ